MTAPVPAQPFPLVSLATVDDMRDRIRRKGKLKGRQADAEAIAEVRARIGPAPYRRDLLIEYLHQLNDAYRCLHDRHLVALALEMKIPMAEVYEVASFYHHFDVVRRFIGPTCRKSGWRRRSPSF